MSDYGITKKGFVLKRLDRILDEIHSELSTGFKINTRTHESTFLNCLITTFANQIAELWEMGQESYYSKYPATASGISLDNAVQYSGIKRKSKTKTVYPLHCSGVDGTIIPEGTVVSTKTNPEIRLKAIKSFKISRDKCTSVDIKTAITEKGIYAVTINGVKYSYVSKNGDTKEILGGLKNVIKNSNFKVYVNDEMLSIKNVSSSDQFKISLSENLTTEKVTVIASFETFDYGRVFIPNGLVVKIITNVPGLISVINRCSPIYGREQQTDIELRHDYLRKCSINSNSMIESIIAEILSNVSNVKTVLGYENFLNEIDERGLPPHSIEIIVDGGNDEEIGRAILRKKAGGIQTYGNVSVNVSGFFGNFIPVKFTRPENVYVWLKIVLHGDENKLNQNYKNLIVNEFIKKCENVDIGEDLFIQKIANKFYDFVNGLTFVDISSVTSSYVNFSPKDSDFKSGNIYVTERQKIKVYESMIEVNFINDIR